MMLVPLTVARATEQATTLIVLTKDNVQHHFVLDDKPEVKFNGANLDVICEKASASASFALSDVIRFTYAKLDPFGIMGAASDTTAVSYQDGTLVISQLKADAMVGVYSMEGRLVKQLTARHAGTYRLSLSQLPSGVYLVKADNITYKITKQ